MNKPDDPEGDITYFNEDESNQDSDESMETDGNDDESHDPVEITTKQLLTTLSPPVSGNNIRG